MFARTERLMLRPSWPEDAGAIFTAIKDEAIVRNLAQAPWPYELADARSFASLEHSISHPNFLLWKRTDSDPVLIGSCGLAEKDGEAELGYWIARAHWGKGYATEAARAVIDIAQTIGHRRLVCGHFEDNPVSGKVMRKLGFRPTGRVEQRFSKGRGKTVACVLMAMDLEKDENGDNPGNEHPAMRANYRELRAA